MYTQPTRECCCHFCGGRMIWDSDFNWDEWFGDDGSGVVAVLHCPDCGAEATFALKDDDDGDA